MSFNDKYSRDSVNKIGLHSLVSHLIDMHTRASTSGATNQCTLGGQMQKMGCAGRNESWREMKCVQI